MSNVIKRKVITLEPHRHNLKTSNREILTTNESKVKVDIRWYDDGSIVAKAMPHSHEYGTVTTDQCGEVFISVDDDIFFIPDHTHVSNCMELTVSGGVRVDMKLYK